MAESRAAYQREYYSKNHDKMLAREQRRRLNLDYLVQRRKWGAEWIKEHKEQYNSSKWAYRDKLKIEVLTHYSIDGKIECAICGFDNIYALCIDHINNDGATHRKKLKSGNRGGFNLYEKLRQQNYPAGLQILCANCNMIKEIQRKHSIRMKNSYYKKRKEVMGDGHRTAV